jgi:hypothetical protein
VKALVFRVLPIIVGIVIGFLIVSPPQFLGLPFLVRMALILPLAAGAMLAFFMFMIGASLPADVKLRPIDQRNVTEGMLDLYNGYREAGFDLAGAPLKVEVNPPAVLVPLTDGQGQMYGTIFRTGTDPPRTACDIVTVFEPEGALTTGSLPEGAALPMPPGAFVQIFRDADIRTMRDRHLEALQYLASQGVRLKPATAQNFPGDFRRSMNRMRDHFWTNPLWHTLITVYRSSTGNTPHEGAVAKQPAAQASLRKLQENVV